MSIPCAVSVPVCVAVRVGSPTSSDAGSTILAIPKIASPPPQPPAPTEAKKNEGSPVVFFIAAVILVAAIVYFALH